MESAGQTMRVNEVEIVDTFAEAFPMTAARVVVTAANSKWARIAAQTMSGYATSVIGCDAEAGIERELSPEESPDGRPGCAVLLFAFSRDGLEKAVSNRVGQCVMTCATSACYSGLPTGEKSIAVGARLRHFGDGLQISKQLPDGRRIWRIPVMDGEFVCDDRFGTLKGVAGGNLILIGRDPAKTLAAAEHAVEAMRAIPGVIAPFPGGVVRSGSKVGSRYKMLRASTNTAFTPTTRGLRPSLLPQDANCAYEIVIDGLTLDGVERATAAGIHAAADPRWELLAISAGNYGGKLGPYHIQLHDVIRRYPMPNATITRPLEG